MAAEKAHRGEITYGELTPKNLGQLKVLNQAVFPVQYSDKFYKDLEQAWLGYSLLAYYSEVLVGAVCCRLEKTPENPIPKLYIMTLGVLTPYRKFGIGRKLLEKALEWAKADKVSEIYLHVQTNNDGAIKFYDKFGFTKGEKIENYYKKIDPPDCYILFKKFDKTA